MRALTLKPPWPYAIFRLGKEIENRTWRPPKNIIGERIAIHSGKTFDVAGYDWIFSMSGFKGVPTVTADDLAQGFPNGSIVGTVEIAGCLPINEIEQPSVWAFGPFCWILTECVELKEPIKCSGALGLWKVPKLIENKISIQSG